MCNQQPNPVGVINCQEIRQCRGSDFSRSENESKGTARKVCGAVWGEGRESEGVRQTAELDGRAGREGWMRWGGAREGSLIKKGR
jgi:hypothetical protein